MKLLNDLFKNKDALKRDQVLIAEYYNCQIAYNHAIGCDGAIDVFAKGSSSRKEAALHYIEREQRRKSSFLARYSQHTRYLVDEFLPDIDYAYSETNEYFDEGGFMHNDLKTALKAAGLNSALLKWMPRRFRHNAEVLLAACVNTSISDCRTYFERDSFPYLTDEDWEETTYFYRLDSGKPQSTNACVPKLSIVAALEKPIVDVYERARDSIRSNDIGAYLQHSEEIEALLRDAAQTAVFYRCARLDDTNGIESDKHLVELRKKALAHKLDETLSRRPSRCKPLKI